MGRKIIIWLAAFLISTNLAIVLLVIFVGKSPPPPPLPNPNGYDDFVKAGDIVVSNDSKLAGTNQVAYFSTMTRAELSVVVSTNAEALRLVRLGLGRQCLVPLEYSTNYMEKIMPQLGSSKRLGMLLAAEGRLADLEDRTNDMARIALEGIRFAQESSRGGFMICRLVGLACENLAYRPLPRLASSLDAQGSREMALALENIDAHEEPLETTLKQEQLWSQKTGGWRWRITALFNKKMLAPVTQSFTSKVQTNTRNRRQLMTDFAAHAYEQEKGKRARAWSDLVPTYLKAVPKDPATGKDLVLPP